MFEIGDHVVYPYHGAGTITDKVERTILGKEETYVVLTFPMNQMTIMLPEEKLQASGIRSVITLDKVQELIEHSLTLKPAQEFSRRDINDKHDKMKSGCIFDCTTIYTELMLKKKHSPDKLHIEERKQLDFARQLLKSELDFVEGLSSDEIEEFLSMQNREDTSELPSS
ncbi:hypothetical protein FLK61_29575 [Paenalkalicoccus suaedae]|uniref:CarD-like/TRCF RNAP-interacting domain-containing protein n=1 Tax=Paenalkalicoccus suaedae TaxID=2592382 RepID=A0A859FCA6_9BACI|nr:CarD family transcriptional regulator [Paenalkalicoccus suaedae]QKS70879.1 hypothetical protein FLK61_29575 [Paenalkalicoccus suaedae]